MTIKITLEYPSLEHAILALGKLAGGRAARAASKTETVGAGGTAERASSTERPPAAPTVEVSPTTRKGRSDKGKPRGPYKNTPAPDVGSSAPAAEADPSTGGAAAPEVGVTEAEAPAAAQGTGPVAAPSANPQELLEKLVAAKGIPTAMEVLAKFGVKRLRELPAEKHGDFIAEVNVRLA